MTTAIVDYESGNLHSAEKAFQRMARESGAGAVHVTSDPDRIRRADRIVLPGDGAFPACRGVIRARSVGNKVPPPSITLTRHCPQVPRPPQAEGR